MTVTAEYYKEIWHGNFDGSDEELNILLERAEDIVNNTVFLSGYTVDTVSQNIQSDVYKAVCSQADYISENGGIEALSYSSIQSVSIGKFNYTASAKSNNISELCSQAVSYLMPTGLLYRGI